MEKKATRDALGAEVLALGLEHKDVFVIDCDHARHWNLQQNFLNSIST